MTHSKGFILSLTLSYLTLLSSFALAGWHHLELGELKVNKLSSPATSFMPAPTMEFTGQI